MKRALDAVLAALGLIACAPLLLALAAAVRATSRGPALYRQERMGKGSRPFVMLKFRTMRLGAEECGPLVTASGDRRITRLGRVLRRTKLDELPQLWNVLRGDMSLVGPRPQTRPYFERYREAYGEVLAAVRPGITDFAAISYRDEEGVLARRDDPEDYYVRYVIPEKLELYRRYVAERSLRTDLHILLQTARILFVRTPPAPRLPAEPPALPGPAVPVALGRAARAAPGAPRRP